MTRKADGTTYTFESKDCIIDENDDEDPWGAEPRNADPEVVFLECLCRWFGSFSSLEEVAFWSRHGCDVRLDELQIPPKLHTLKEGWNDSETSYPPALFAQLKTYAHQTSSHNEKSLAELLKRMPLLENLYINRFSCKTVDGLERMVQQMEEEEWNPHLKQIHISEIMHAKMLHRSDPLHSRDIDKSVPFHWAKEDADIFFKCLELLNKWLVQIPPFTERATVDLPTRMQMEEARLKKKQEEEARRPKSFGQTDGPRVYYFYS